MSDFFILNPQLKIRSFLQMFVITSLKDIPDFHFFESPNFPVCQHLQSCETLQIYTMCKLLGMSPISNRVESRTRCDTLRHRAGSKYNKDRKHFVAAESGINSVGDTIQRELSTYHACLVKVMKRNVTSYGSLPFGDVIIIIKCQHSTLPILEHVVSWM